MPCAGRKDGCAPTCSSRSSTFWPTSEIGPTTMKRGRGEQPISLDEILAHHRFDLEPVETLTADQIYERRWATTLLDQVLAGLDR